MSIVTIPHWQKALNGKLSAIKFLQGALSSKHGQNLRELGFTADLNSLKTAQTYSFNDETIAAIRAAAKSIPHDAPLSSIETPSARAGWFYFATPLAITSSTLIKDHVQALLWRWARHTASYKVTIDTQLLERAGKDVMEKFRQAFPDGSTVGTLEMDLIKKVFTAAGVQPHELDKYIVPEQTEPTLTFTAYVRDLNELYVGKEAILPSARWTWPLDMTFHDMIAYNRVLHRRDYGENSEIGKQMSMEILSEEETLYSLSELSLFFIMSCLWFRQTVPGQSRKKIEPILELGDGHIERHERKRQARDFNLDWRDVNVKVVSLRKTAKTESVEPSEHREGTKNYQCRWVVDGHARMQAYGPGRRDRKLVWITPYIGNAKRIDLPLRTAQEKVFAVER